MSGSTVWLKGARMWRLQIKLLSIPDAVAGLVATG